MVDAGTAAVVNIVLEDELTAAKADRQWTPTMIIEALKKIDPDDLDDVQQGLYEFLWGEGGLSAKTGRTS